MHRYLIAVLGAGICIGAFSIAGATVQPAPRVGSEITVTNGGIGSDCFDTLQNLKWSEQYLDKWSGDKMDNFLNVHSLGFFDGDKARVLAIIPTYRWRNSAGSDDVRPIRLLIESPHVESGRNWQGRTCWWEFSQNDMDLELIWWK
ncbi:hypothetical protein EPN52_13700 [bacterium]|nr:MAG: hypothetical protein EPN52_13700 [bacterium]